MKLTAAGQPIGSCQKTMPRTPACQASLNSALHALDKPLSILEENGVAHLPVGVDLCEPAMLFELQNAGLEIRDGQQTMLDAREIKCMDEIMLLNTAAAMVDGVYDMIFEKLRPGVKESQIVADSNKMLYELGSDDVEAINAVAGERCSPHPHNFTDRRRFSTLFSRTWVTAPVTTVPLTSAVQQIRKEMPTNSVVRGWTPGST